LIKTSVELLHLNTYISTSKELVKHRKSWIVQ